MQQNKKSDQQKKVKKKAVAFTVIVAIKQIKSVKKTSACIIFYKYINYKFESRMNS